MTEGFRPVLRQPWALAAAALLLSVYVAVLAVMPKDGFYSPDEGAKFVQLHSVEWRGGLHYDIAYGGRDIDPDFAFYPTRCRNEDIYPVQRADGAVTFHWPIWFSVGTGFLVQGFGMAGLYVVPMLSGWVSALLAGWLMRAWNPRLAPLAILAVGLATPVAFFSLTFWEHTLATLLGMIALAIVASRRPLRAAPAAVSVVLILIAAVLRIEMFLFGAALVCGWYVAGRRAQPTPRAHVRSSADIRWRSWRWPILGALLAAGVALLSGVIADRHIWLITHIPGYLGGAFAKLPHIVETLTGVLVDTPGNQSPVIAQGWRLLMLAAYVAAACAPLARRHGVEAALLLSALVAALEFSAYLVLQPEAYVSLHGFLPVAPVLVLSAYAVAPVWRQRRYAQLAIATAGFSYALLAFAAIFVFQATAEGVVPTGLEWGNRYLFMLYPVGTMLALAALYEYARSPRPAWLRNAVVAAAVGLVLCGALLQARGVFMLVETRRLVTTWQAALRDGPPVVTDVWWLPAAMAPLFISHELQCVRRSGDLGGWFAATAPHGVDRVTFASFRPLDIAALRGGGFDVAAEDEQVVSGLRLVRLRFTPAARPGSGGAP